jgi:hypothetical protein
MGLLAGVREQPAGIEFLDGNAAAAIGKKVHGITPASFFRAPVLPRLAAKSYRGAVGWVSAAGA